MTGTATQLDAPNQNFAYRTSDAQTLVPIVLSIIGTPKSVVDVGGGVGVWCNTLKMHGVERTICIDSPAQDLNGLQIPKNDFLPFDLQTGLPDPVPSDLALCLEAAEHLREDLAPDLVYFLVRSAPVVLFSAAIPGQPGHGHINCQPPEYWDALFSSHGYKKYDVVRSQIIHMKEISYWYRQNLLLYCAAGFEPASTSPGTPEDFELVHQKVLARYRRALKFQEAPSLGWVLQKIPAALAHTIRRRFKHFAKPKGS